MSKSTRIVISGAAGRMGHALSKAVTERDDAVIVAAVVRSGSPRDGTPTGIASAPVYSSAVPATTKFDVLIDVAGTSGFSAGLQLAVQRSVAFVSGSTGLDDSQLQALQAAAQRIPVLWAANFSIGVAVLAHLVGQAASLLPEWDIEIFEAHHRHKLDAPSGTALMLGQRAADARGIGAADSVSDRTGARIEGSIGYAVSRGGDVVGEHEVRLFGSGERVELIHRACNRDIFAIGALRAARWLSPQKPGRYSMADMLGLVRK